MTDRNTMISAFDAAAQDSVRLGEYLWGPIGRATAAAARLDVGERVLDACCGTGASAMPAAEAVGSTGCVDAVDRSRTMIATVDRQAVDRFQLRGHADDVLTWTEGGYDAVLCGLGIFFFPDMSAGTEALLSRLRPGGRLVATIWRRGAMEVPGRHLRAAVAEVKGAPPPPPRPPHLIDEINDAEAYGPWLAARGLVGVTVSVLELGLPATADLAWLVITGSGYQAALQGLSPDQVADVRQGYLAGLAADGVDRIDGTTLIGSGDRPV